MRAADDFTAIRARMEQLQRERLGRCETEQWTARTDAHIGLGVWLECMYLTLTLCIGVYPSSPLL